MNEKQRLTKMYMPLYAACGFTAGGFVLFIFSFSSPYWLESYSYVHSSFLHMGIWSVCFNKFIHPQDYHANELTGCYWVYDRFFFKIGIWEWLNPYWLIAIQTLIVIAFIAEICSVIILVLYYLLYGQPAAESTIVCGLQLLIGTLLSTTLAVFGIQSQDHKWMQRPEHNFLSWSYGFLILAAICSFISGAFLCCVSYTDRAAQREVEHYETVEGRYGLVSTLAGSHFPPTTFSRSVYGATPHMGGGVLVNVPGSGDHPSQTVEIGAPSVYPTSVPLNNQLWSLLEEDIRPYVEKIDNTEDEAGQSDRHGAEYGQYRGGQSSGTPVSNAFSDYLR